MNRITRNCAPGSSVLPPGDHEDLGLAEHMRDAVNSLRIVLAADESVRAGRTIELN